MMFPHPEEFARNCIDIISVKDNLAVMLYPNKSIRIITKQGEILLYPQDVKVLGYIWEIHRIAAGQKADQICNFDHLHIIINRGFLTMWSLKNKGEEVHFPLDLLGRILEEYEKRYFRFGPGENPWGK